jgi:hypothetical protein
MVYTVDLLGDANLRVRDLTITRNTYLANVVVDASADLQSVTTSGSTTTNSVEITSAQSSTSKLTGALKVTGGVGVQGNVYVGSNLFVSSNLGVQGNVHVGSNLFVTGNVEVGTANLFVDSLTGNIGIGTTEPTESLDIVGNLNLQKVSNTASIKLNSNVVTEYTRSKKLIKYPRVFLTSAAGESSGYQGYYVTESSNSADTDRHSWKAFEGTTDNSTSDNAWAPDETTTTYNGTDNIYNGSVNLGTGAVNGEWIKLQLPNKIKLEYMKIWLKDNDSTRIPEDWRLYGSNDDTNWTELFSKTGQGAVNENLYTINATSMYKYLAVVVTRIAAQNDYFRIVELEYYGTPEYDPDAHGTDVIARSVPNVPNTDWLEVYWDGQDYTSMPPTVTDKSGNGVTGTPNGGVGFDTEYKAFTFDGVDDYISGTLSNPSGDWVHSVSLWYRQDSAVTATLDYIYHIGLAASGQASLLAFKSDGYIVMANYASASVRGEFVPTLGKWYHITVVYSGGGVTIDNVSIYLDGTIFPGLFHDGDGSSVSLAANANFNIGRRINNGDYAHGSIANFRLFDRALTGDEVWQLYAYQKEYFNVSPDVVTFKGGRVGIGTLEPRAPLDVMGIPYGPGARPIFFATNDVDASDTVNAAGIFTDDLPDVHLNVCDCYDGTTGRFTAKIAGVYMFVFHVLVFTTTSERDFCQVTFYLNGTNVNRASTSRGLGYIIHQAVAHADGEFLTMEISRPLYLNVGDYVQVGIQSITRAEVETGRNYSWFTGYLLS